MTDAPRILVVDDDASLLRLLGIRLRSAGYQVETAPSGEQALARLEVFHPQLVITDLRMEGMDGMALFEAVHRRHPSLPVIILTAHGTIPDAVEATSRGVFGYLTKPFDSQRLLADVERALRCSGGLPEPPRRDDDWCGDIVTRSPVMNELLQQARRAAASEAAILIQSESGTGKELLARAIHSASPRRERAFLALNCAAIPEALLESELFGHEKGAFTGATRSQPGLFQTADGGTLFLDEIGDMPLSFQAKLLRVLQDGQVRPVGATRSQAVNVRIVSATHRDLEQAVGKGEFREDLFYRLNVIMLELPPLRDRREDIPLLAGHFLSQARSRSEGTQTAASFSPEAIERLVAAPWPGNVRQLVNVIEQCAVLSTTAVIPASLVERALRGQSDRLRPLAEARDEFERNYLIRLLRVTDGNVAQASRLAGRNRTEFYKLLRRHQLDPESFRSG